MCRVEMKNLVNLIKLSQPDVMIVSSEGMKFPTWRLLLALHSPLLARLLQTLKPAEEGLLAISLPLPYTTVSSMLAILSEGGNFDYLGEATELLGIKIPDIFPSPAKVSSVGKSSRSLLKANITIENSEQSSATKSKDWFPKIQVDTPSEKDMSDIKSQIPGEYSDVKEEAQSESEEEDEPEEENLELDFELEANCNSKKSTNKRGSSDPPLLISPGCLAPGLVFPNHDAMMAAINEWSQANFSPLVTTSSFGGKPGTLHTFGCPHRKKKKSKSAGIRQCTHAIQYADCPVLIKAKANKDGSYTVTRAELEHRGHEVSEEQYFKYRKTRKLTSEQENAVLALLIQGGKLPEIAKMLSDFTGRNLGRKDVYNVVRKLQKQSMVVDTETGEKRVEFRGVQVPAEGLGLTQVKKKKSEQLAETEVGPGGWETL